MVVVVVFFEGGGYEGRISAAGLGSLGLGFSLSPCCSLEERRRRRVELLCLKGRRDQQSALLLATCL